MINSKLGSTGTSPVLGTILLVAMTVSLVGTVTAYKLELEPPKASPVTRLSFEKVEDGDNLFYITNEGGDTIGNVQKELEMKVKNADLTDNAVVTVSGEDNNCSVGERIEVELNDFSKSGRVKVIHRPTNALIAKSKSELEATSGGPDIPAEGAEIQSYQPPEVSECDLLVDGSWPGSEDTDNDDNFSTISAAVDNSSPGDLIGVKSGTYEEAIDVNKNISLSSLDGPEETVIDAGGNESAVYVTGEMLTLRGFKIKNFDPHGVDFQNGSNSFVGSNIFLGSEALSAVQAFSSTDNVVVSNNIMKGTAGVRAYISCDNWIITHNTINCSDTNHHGIVGGGEDYKISHNEIEGCSGKYQGIDTYQLGSSSAWNITHNNIHNCYDGIQIGGTGHETHFNNIYDTENYSVWCNSSFNAENNWWGTEKGSEIDNMVSTSVDYDPWLDEPH